MKYLVLVAVLAVAASVVGKQFFFSKKFVAIAFKRGESITTGVTNLTLAYCLFPESIFHGATGIDMRDTRCNEESYLLSRL